MAPATGRLLKEISRLNGGSQNEERRGRGLDAVELFVDRGLLKAGSHPTVRTRATRKIKRLGRIPLPRKRSGPQTTKKGKKGYDRKQQKKRLRDEMMRKNRS
jgi:hypothetical protein